MMFQFVFPNVVGCGSIQEPTERKWKATGTHVNKCVKSW